MESNFIKCPSCSLEINVGDTLAHQIEEDIKTKILKQVSQKEADLNEQVKKLIDENAKIQSKIENEFKNKLINEKTQFEKEIRLRLAEESASAIKSLNLELNEKSKQIQELNLVKIELEKSRREKEELRQKIAIEKEVEFSSKLNEERVRIHKLEQDNHQLKYLEMQKQLEDQKKLLEEMQRKANQGSMQLQGEVQEIALEEILKQTFPFDTIEEVAKGVRGADVLQIVRNQLGIECGKIIYESKRTKNFQNDWIYKLKSDALLVKADICVLVTDAMPDGVTTVTNKEGVWVCNFKEFRGFILVLRDSLLRIYTALQTQSNKGEKMEMLYQYLMSTDFKNQMEAVLMGFRDLQNSYHQEKMSMEKLWKKREKQLEKILLNTNHFLGSIQGIAGGALNDIKSISAEEDIETE